MLREVEQWDMDIGDVCEDEEREEKVREVGGLSIHKSHYSKWGMK